MPSLKNKRGSDLTPEKILQVQDMIAHNIKMSNILRFAKIGRSSYYRIKTGERVAKPVINKRRGGKPKLSNRDLSRIRRSINRNPKNASKQF